MRLTSNNIRFVKEFTCNGKPYRWYVAMKSNCVSDGRDYRTIDEDNCILYDEEWPIDQLPKSVQKFIEKSIRETFIEEAETKWGTISQYIYRSKA